jgi:hypothetical protein
MDDVLKNKMLVEMELALHFSNPPPPPSWRKK